MMKLKKLLVIAILILGSWGISGQGHAQECFLGEVRMFAGTFAPRNWAFADGQTLPINQNQSLYSLYGTMYGGDGRTDFALPDLRGRAIVGVGTDDNNQTIQEGQKVGAETVDTSTTSSHIFTGVKYKDDASNNVPDSNSKRRLLYANSAIGEDSHNEVVDATGSIGVGQSQLNNQDNRQPFLAIRHIVCIRGLFPSRS